MSEPAPEETPDDQEVEETEEQPDDEDQEGQPPADDVAKMARALKRAQAEAKKHRLKAADLAKQIKEGSPDLGEAEQLKKQVADIRQELATSRAVVALLGAGFNGSDELARRILRTVDDLSDMDTVVEELQVDFPERFGKRGTPPGPRPFTGRGDSTTGKKKTDDEIFVERLMKASRRP